jgi:alanine-synthesizing transaminase
MFARRTGWRLTENRFTVALNKARGNENRLIDLTVSNPTHCNFNFESATILSSLAQADCLNYDPDPQGLLGAREAVRDYYSGNRVGRNAPLVSPLQVFLTTSTSESYSYLFRLLCDPGNEVLVPRPSYPLFEFLADIQDVQLRSYDLFYDHGWHIDVGGLKRAVTAQTRAVLVVNPNNPTGSFVHASEMEQLASLCRERNLALISDEVFLDYEVESRAEVSAAFSDGCLSFTLSGLSKISCLPQMKLAWIVINGPPELRNQAHIRLQLIADTYLSVNAPTQHALSPLLQQKDRIQPQVFQRIRANLKFLDEQLRSARSIQRLKVEGGWYAVLRIPAKKPDEDLAIELIERAGVIAHPSHFYDFPQEGYLVVSLITPEELFQKGIAAALEIAA